MESVCDIIRRAETNYLQGNVALGKYVNWSMHDTIERVDAYLNSKHISGETDSLGRDKPFFNIVTAATNIWWRATEVDRKDIRFVPTESSAVVLAFVANVILQKWMEDNRFGLFLKQWGRSLSRYGSSIPKFVEKEGKLIPSITPWNRFIADPVQFDALPRIEKFYLTPAQLRKMPEYDADTVDALINARNGRKTLDKQKKDIMNDFVELYEVHGEMDTRLLKKNPDMNLDEKDVQYSQQMHIVSFVQGASQDEWEDFTLYKGREAKDPYMITHLIEEDGRTLAIGAVEYLFDAQWMANHTVKNMKDTLDMASRLIFQTADTHFVGRNVLTAIETGDILIHGDNQPLEMVQNNKPDIEALQNFGNMWNSMAQELTSTPEALRGVATPRSPYALQSLLTQQANSLFEVMTENKGIAIEEMMKRFVIPFIKKQLKNTKEVVAILDDAGIQEIDAMYVPREAIKQYNKKSADAVFANADAIIKGGAKTDLTKLQPVQPFDSSQEEPNVKKNLAPLGNKRFFSPDETSKKTWAQIFSDFEWNSVKVEVTNENHDAQQAMQTLTMVLQTIAQNPAILQDPNAKMVFSAILNETGVISPLQLSTATMQQQQTPQRGQPPQTPTPPASPGGGVAPPLLAQPKSP